jgi:hypothetical protein
MKHCEKQILASSCPSVCMQQLGSHWKDFYWISYLNIFQKSVEKTQGSLKYDKDNGYSTWRLIRIYDLSRSVFLRMTNISDKLCTENQNTHFIFNNFSRKSCCLWDNVEKYGTARQGTDDNMTRRMLCACWITKAIGTHSEYVILTSFTWQQCFANAPLCYKKIYFLSR